jgi:hypothetical protein
MSEKQEKEDIFVNEDALLRRLLEAVEYQQNEVVTIEIARKGKVYFQFRIRPISEKEAERCSDLATKYTRSAAFGYPKIRTGRNIAPF